MVHSLLYIFQPGKFEPHGDHFVNTPVLFWTFVISNLLIFAAYVLIPVALVYFVRRRKDLLFRGIFLLFGAFIVLCGIHHLIHTITFWYPIYGIEAVNDVATALVSIGTFFALLPIIPLALQLKTPQETEAINEQLKKEITARTEKEKTLIATLNALDNTALVSMTDAQGTILSVNEKFTAVSKYTRGELIGQNHRILKSGQQPDTLFVDLWNTISSGRVWRGEIKNKAKDGTYYWVDTCIAPIMDESGKPERYMSVRFLITEKKEAEAQSVDALKKEKESHQALLNLMEDNKKLDHDKEQISALLRSIGDGLFATDIDGKIVLMNEACERQLGWKFAEVQGKRFDSIIRMEDENRQPVPYEERKITQCLHGHKDAIPEATKAFNPRYYIRSDGSSFPVTVTVTPVIRDGNVAGAIEVFRDVSQEVELDQRQRDFISVASHQLRTPVTALRLCIELLSKDKFGTLTKEQAEVLKPAMGYAIALAETIHSLLAVSRAEAGTTAMELSEVTVTKLLDEIRMEHEFWFTKKQQHIDITCPEDVVLTTDKGILKEILANLFSNGIRYTPELGTVSMRVSREGETVRFDVTDSGMGIPKAVQGKIFEKFFRADNARSKVTDGTGLGLYLVHSLVGLIGGKIEFVSEENKGTTFSLFVPVTPPAHVS